MKLKIAVFSLILIFLLPIFSHAQPMGMRPWKKETRGGRASELNLTSEQAKELNRLQQTHLQETQLLRAQLITRRLELRELLTSPSVRTESIRVKYVEVVETQSKLEEKTIEYLIKVRGLLSHEQLRLWCPEEECPLSQRMMPGHRPMRRMNPMRALPPEE
jgi:Spy/CpxP family protein refolding chaperone